MTCIVGVEHEGGVLIGGDSAGSSTEYISTRLDTKVFAVGPYAMGFTSSYRMGQLLRYTLEPPMPTHDDLDDMDRFIATKFIESVRKVLKDGGFTKITDGVNQEQGGNFLVGIAGRLYAIEDDFQFSRNAAGYESVGSGYHLALGSLHTTAEFDLTPRQRVEYDLNAAAGFCPSVAGPFVLFNAPRELDL